MWALKSKKAAVSAAKGFEFEEKGTLNICGKAYAVDVADAEFIDAVVNNFAHIAEQAQNLVQLKKNFEAAKKENLREEKILQASKELIDGSRIISDEGKNFIQKALGHEAYAEIFKDRRPNVIDHINLCTYIYTEALKQREDLLQEYIDSPEDPKNRRQRRAVAKAAARIGR